MYQMNECELDHVQDALVRAVLYPFAVADYDGQDSISIKAVQSSDILDGISPDLLNEALATTQRSGLITWDEHRIGAIRLSEVGFKKFLLVRDGFFDARENSLLRSELLAIVPEELQRSDVYQRMKKSCLGLGARPGQPCPVSGRWQARRLENACLLIGENETIPFPAYDDKARRVIWYLLAGSGE